MRRRGGLDRGVDGDISGDDGGAGSGNVEDGGEDAGLDIGILVKRRGVLVVEGNALRVPLARIGRFDVSDLNKGGESKVEPEEKKKEKTHFSPSL